MLNSIVVTNYSNESITLELRNPEKSGFLVRRVTGLGPAKADVNVTDLSTSDGGLYNSSRLQTRNIVFAITFLPMPTIEETRRKSYQFFSIKRPVTLRFETDKRIATISGYVESNEIDIFSKEEGAQISIICPDPNFYSAEGSDSGSISFSGITANFEFPFSNESLEENLIEFGIIETSAEKTLWYEGDSETGIILTLHAIGTVENPIIFNVGTREQLRIDTAKLSALTGASFGASDDIIISTIKGQKSIQLLRRGVYTNILNCLDKNADWFQLVRGDNVFAYSADSGAANLQFRIDYPVIYEGI